MPHDVISTCPVCSNELAVTRLHCRSCGTTLEGDFSVGRFGRLNREQLTLLESFLRSRGNLREMERELGISYPTVRVARRGARPGPRLRRRAPTPTTPTSPTAEPATAAGRREEILQALARHEMSAEDAAAAIRALGRTDAMTAPTTGPSLEHADRRRRPRVDPPARRRHPHPRRRRRDRPDPRSQRATTSTRCSPSSSAEGSASLRDVRDGDRLGRRRAAARARPRHRRAAAGDRRHRDRQRRHRGRTGCSATSATGRRRATSRCAAVSGRIDIEAVSGDVDIIATGEPTLTAPDGLGRRRDCAPRRSGRSRRDDQRRPQGRRTAGRSGAVRHRDGQRRRPARARPATSGSR